MRRFCLAILMAAAVLPVHAAERWMGSVTGKVSIDGGGRVTDVKLDRTTISKAMRQTLIERVRAVEFEPATVNGQPAPAETSVCIRLGVDETPTGLSVAVDGIDIIAGYRKTTPPHYPARQLRKGISATVELRVEYGADGVVLAVTPAKADAPMDDFMLAALEAAKHWVLDPERVGGIGVAGKAIIPVRFTIADDSPSKSGSGELVFGDGGRLSVYRTRQDQWTLADARVRVRSIEGAREAIGGS